MGVSVLTDTQPLLKVKESKESTEYTNSIVPRIVDEYTPYGALCT